MQYFQVEPSERWQRHVLCYWFLSAEAAEEAAQPIVPDGRMEWAFHLADPFCRISQDGSIEPQPRWLIIGQMRKPVVVRPTGRTFIAGIQFKPAGAMPFLRAPQRQWTGNITDFSLTHAEIIPELESRFAGVSAANDMRLVLEFLLQQSYCERWEPAEPVLFIVDQLTMKECNLPLSRVLGESGISPRHAERLFSAQVGLTPKEFQRIERFQRVFKIWQSHGNWIETAMECGYYDQSHLIRDFKTFAGLSPTEFHSYEHELSHALTLHRRIERV